MKKRIYISFIALIALCVLILSTLSGLILYNTMLNREKTSVRDKALLISDLLNHRSGGAFFDYISTYSDNSRLTVLAPDGTVLIDSHTVAENLGNHSNRKEFTDAINLGWGEASRLSESIGVPMYYYAVVLNDGNVLRVANTMNGITKVFIEIIPMIAGATLIILLIANLFARHLTDSIVKPINSLDFENGAVPVYDELAPYIKRIERQTCEIDAQIRALQERADTMQAITGSMKEGLLLIDENFIVVSANKSAKDIFKKSDIMGAALSEVCQKSEMLEAAKKTFSGNGVELRLDKDGKNYSVYFSPVKGGDEVTGAVILFVDTTDRHNVEKHRREFTANVSHELKTPLTTISALAEMIENGMAKNNDIYSFAAKISDQTKRLINIIGNIIRISEFDEGRVYRGLTEFDVCEVAKSVAEALRENALNKNITIDVHGENAFLYANRQMIDELIYNLTDNAIKYNNTGGNVLISAGLNNGNCEIKVCDTGIGIPEEERDRVFERFYRTDKSRSNKTGGTGLGLSIVKHIIEYHKGLLILESREGQGTEITCRIPDNLLNLL